MTEARRIVVIDDYEPFLALLQEALSFQGYEAHSFERHAVTLDRLAEIDPHLVVIDPIADPNSPVPSFAVLRAIRRDDRFDRIPILVCAPVTSIEDQMDELRALGRIHFLAKPFDGLMLAAVVAALAHGQEPPDTAALPGG